MRDGVAATMAWLPTMPWGKLPDWFAAPRKKTRDMPLVLQFLLCSLGYRTNNRSRVFSGAVWVSPLGAVEPNDVKEPAIL